MVIDGYVRVSVVGERKGERFISPSVQRGQIEGWARLHGAVVAEVFEELDESGGRADRPLLLEAISRVERGDSDGLVVAYLSRFGRSLIDGLRAIQRITDAGGRFVSVQESLDFSTDTGRLILRVLLSIAEWELDRYRTNLRVASERAVERGVYIRRAPFGYLRPKGGDGRLRVDPHTAPVVSELFLRRAEGATYTELQRWLSGRGIRTRMGNSFWHEGSLRSMLRNRVYLGESRYLTTVNAAAHPGLIDVDTWERAQFGGLRTPRRFSSPPLLWGLARCASCRRPLSQSASYQGPYAGMGAYRCHSFACRAVCPSPVKILQPLLDPYVEQLFWQELRAARPLAHARRLTRLEQTVAVREQELVRYRDNPHLPIKLDDARFADGVGLRQRRLDRARAELSRARYAATPPVLPPTAELQARWPSMTTDERRGAIGQVIDCVFVWNGRTGAEARTCVLRRGDAPRGLPNVREPLQATPPPFERAESAAGLKLRGERDWDTADVRAAVAELLQDKPVWPTYQEFQAAGRGLLYRQIERNGGTRQWAAEFGLALTMTWTDGTRWSDERIRAALEELIDDTGRWPTWQEFRDRGAEPLRYAVKATGGAEFWARDIGAEFSPQQRTPTREWTYASMKATVARLAGSQDGWPPAKQFEAAGLGGLHQAIRRRGLEARIAADLGMPAPPTRRKRTLRWTPGEIRAALDQFFNGRDTWPTAREFTAAGLAGLRTVMYRERIVDHWASEYGLTIRGRDPVSEGNASSEATCVDAPERAVGS